MHEPIESHSAWVATATAGLPPSAAAKFRAEIGDHFAEARARHLGEGMSAEEAERAALADLGDPLAVRRSLRDEYFSRGRYRQGMLAAVLLLVVSLPGVSAAVLSNAVGEAHLPNANGQWTWVISFVGALVGPPLLLVAGRALLTLLREQYDVSTPRWFGRALAGCALATLPAGLLIPAMVWGLSYSPFKDHLRYSTASDAAFAVLPASQALHQAALIAAGALLLGLALRLRSSSAPPEPGLALLAVMGGLSGLVMIGVGCVMVVAVFLPQPYPQNVPLLMFVNSLSAAVSIGVIAPEVILLALFAWMRGPGAALTA